jgi:acyl-CoA synthetase (AMP-forming)/AMP-acid ligase II
MVSALPGVTETKPGRLRCRFPASASTSSTTRAPRRQRQRGLLVLTKPWPSMLRGIWGDPERFVETYWEKFQDKGFYFAGDGARLDEDGDVWFLGRVDDVMNVSGHRLSTTEIESALVGNEAVAEAAVVGAADETTGQAVVAFCVLKESFLKAHDVDGIADVLRRWVGEQIGPIARPRDVHRHRAAEDPLGRSCVGSCATWPRARGRRHHDAGRHHGHVDDPVEGHEEVGPSAAAADRRAARRFAPSSCADRRRRISASRRAHLRPLEIGQLLLGRA